ncbi:MAG: adenylate/guanylate cyclase domain-containing protein [Halothiobacillaceae bacterium]|nr:adenylate/guanylate cyclase domain-containing protein [Halothiobacillaceae bacterium]
MLISVLIQFGTPALPDPANEWLRDGFVQLRASGETDPRIVVVDIDEASLIQTGPWPWPRTLIADLAESILHDYGASGVALDMVMPEIGDIGGDDRLSGLAQSSPLVLAQALDYDRRSAPLKVGVIAGGLPPETAPAQAVAHGFIANHRLFSTARHVGNIGFIPDPDGVIRRLPPYTYLENRIYPTLSLSLIRCCVNPEFVMPALSGSALRIPYSRKLSSYTVVSAADILGLKIPLSMLSGKLVLVGSSALGLSDSVATPLSPNTSGMFVHAAMLSSWLDWKDDRAPGNWPGKLLAALFSILVILISTYALPRLPALLNASLLVLFSALWIVLAFFMALHDDAFSASGPLYAFLFMLMVAVPYQWQMSQHKSRALLDTLNHYVAPVVVRELLDAGLKNPLSPKQAHITTLIADMEGYTKHIEGLDLDAAAALTREFLDCLTVPVLNCRGTLDKFTGDGVVAFWGAPIHDEEHADRALDAAREILQQVGQLNVTRLGNGLPPVRVRVGIESGVAMAGDFGASSRSIYTAVGGCVNTASRLQELARDFPYDVIVGPGTVSLSKRHHFIELEETRLRGKSTSTQLFALAPDSGSAAVRENGGETRLPGRG